MKTLVRLLLINWYRLEQESIEIVGHTAVIGPNASGKSSLLDAIQAVLVGGDKRWWNPNPSAGEKSTRSLRDYCLGVVRDPNNPDLSQAFRPRDQAITYLVLVFQDRQSSEPISIGLALHARLDEAQEVVDGRFVAPGLDLVLSDLVDRTPAGPTPKPWRRVREDLRTRSGESFQVHSQVGEYQRHLCAVLSDGRRHLDPARFLRAFRNAITFAPIRNVSDFVRGHILEERPIQVRSLQIALRHYREIQTRTREALKREEALGAIDRLYQRALQAERLGLAWRWVEQEAGFNALESELAPLREALGRLEREIAGLAERIAQLDGLWQQADSALEEANRRLAATNVEQQRERVQAELRTASGLLADAGKDIEGARLGLGPVHRLIDRADRLGDPGLVRALQDLQPLLRRDEGLLAAAWPAAPVELMIAVDRIAPLVAQTLERMLGQYEQLVREEGEMDQALNLLRARIARLEQGGSDLQPATVKLIALLGEHGIAAVPLCDRVDVANEDWRGALESFLGGHREALLVDPTQVRDAIGIYRREGKRLGIYGSRVINTLKTGEWRDRALPGSLAEIATSDDPHALAYVNQRAGNVLRVDTEDELLRHERAIAADGMLATGGAVLRLRPEEPMLGREARRSKLESLKDRFARDARDQYDKQQEKLALKDLREGQVLPLDQRLQVFPDLVALAGTRDRAQTEIDRLRAEERSLLDDADYRRLKDDAERWRAERTRIKTEADRALADRGQRERAQQSDGIRLEQAQALSEQVAQRRAIIQQTPGFDATLAAGRLEELQAQALFAEEGPAAWRALGQEAAVRAAAQETGMRKRRVEAREQLAGYWSSWPSEHRPGAGSADDHLALAAWALHELQLVQETELAQYVKESENALREAEQAFRSDFVGKLQENLQLLDEGLKELNRNLAHRPFHGQYYRFVKQPEPDLKQVLDWVLDWTPEQGGDVGGLFDAVGDPNHPHREAIARVRNLLMEAAGGEAQTRVGAAAAATGATGGWDERLADYRQYYHFDVRMSDDREGGGNPELLSRRLGKGSGGEHQSPFYVAIGAALAGAYRIERDPDGTTRGGMGLAVFDEAFSKLDLQNTVSALGFLDELGLQVLLAAPDEKYGQIAEHVDTIVNVYRDGGSVYIDAEYIKPHARRALAADNPATRPDRAPEPP
jgi:uncharacterized protein YPO0396